MRKHIFSIILLLSSILSYAAVPQLSDMSQVSLLTCGDGDEVFTKFGHTGIRISDPSNGVDVVFHWGIFMFETPGFALRFMMGNPIYEMGPFYSSVFFEEYKSRGSSVDEQILALTTEQKNRLWNKLWADFADETTQHYLYSFIGSNCATKAYDEIVALYGQNIIFDYKTNFTTYRNIINDNISLSSWFNLGINIIIGSTADRGIGAQQALSFPDYTKEALNNCYYRDSNGNVSPVVIHDHRLLPQTRPYPTPSWMLYIQLLIPLIIIALQSIYYYRHHHYVPILTEIIYSIYGIIGLLILFLWLISNHPLVDDNYNILFFSPLALAVAIILCIKRHHRLKLIASFSLWLSITLYLIPLIFNLQGTTIVLAAYWLAIFNTATLNVATYKHEIKRLFKSPRSIH